MITYRPVGLLVLSLLVAVILSACGGGAAPTQAPVYSPAVTPLTGADAENVATILTADGTAPCGAFNVNGFGPKTADLKAFPGCTATRFSVMCLNDKAVWIGDNISDVKLDGSTLTFTSKQEGTCGIFPQDRQY
jgi:hypothetical protein